MGCFFKRLIIIAFFYSWILLPVVAEEQPNNWEQEYGIQDIAENEIEDVDTEIDESTILPDWIKGYLEIEHREYQHRGDHLLNPDDKLFDFKKYQNTALVDVELNPNLTDNIKFYSKDRYRYQKTDLDSTSQHYSQEIYLQWINDSQNLVVNTGKVKTEWGSGYYWNPVQLLLPNNDENSDSIYEDEGLNMFFMEYSITEVTTTLIIAELNEAYSSQKSRHQAALKFVINLEPWDVGLFLHQATEQSLTNGISFSGLVTDTLEFHGEWASTKQRKRLAPVQQSEGIQYPGFYLPGRYDYEDDQRDSLFHEYMIGIQYTFQTDMNIIMEYFHSDHGFNKEEWSNIQNGIKEAHLDNAWEKTNAPYNSSERNPYAGFLKNTMGELGKDNLRQSYLFLRYDSGEIDENWDFEQVLIFSIDDKSQIYQSTVVYNWQDEIEITGSINIFKGAQYSEFGMNPYNHSATINIEHNF